MRGKKTGGRKKGTLNRATKERQQLIDSAGIDPLTYMLRVMNDPKADPRRRDDMAKAASPYVHPRLTTIESHNDHTSAGQPIVPVINLLGKPDDLN